MNSKRILIIDDDAKILRILKLQLQHNDFEVLTAENGDDALKIYAEDPSIPLILAGLDATGR